MALNGLGVGSVYAVNPLQISRGVPAAEPGSAISSTARAPIAYASASALSATVLVESTPGRHRFPTDAGSPRPPWSDRRPGRRALATSLFLILAQGTG